MNSPVKIKASLSVILKPSESFIIASAGLNPLFSRKIRKNPPNLETFTTLSVMFPTKTDFMNLMAYSQGPFCSANTNSPKNGLR